MYKFMCRVLINLILLKCIIDAYEIGDVKKLKAILFDEEKYDTTIRPIENQSQAIEVDVLFSLVSIVDFDMENGKFEAFGYYLARWFDFFLTWNSSDHGGITRLQLKIDSIWTPQLTQINTMGEHFLVSTVFVESSGRVTLVTTGEFRSICELNMRYFPDDKHTCYIAFVSSGNDISDVTIVPLSDKVGTDNLQPHGKWNVEDTYVLSYSYTDRNTGFGYSTMLNSIDLKRRPRFDLLHSCIPIVFLVFLNIFSHVVPLLSGERMSFSVTVLLALVFWQAIIVDDLPKNSSEVSLVSIIMILSMAQSTLTVAFSVCLCRLANEQDRPIPKYLKKIAWRRKYHKRHIHHRGQHNKHKENDLTQMPRIMKSKPLSAMQMTNLNTIEINIDHNNKTAKKVDCGDIPVTWLDVSETLDKVLGTINVITLLIICIVFIIIFSVN